MVRLLVYIGEVGGSLFALLVSTCLRPYDFVSALLLAALGGLALFEFLFLVRAD